MNIFNSDNCSIAYININAQQCQIMTSMTYIILKVESMIKKPIVANHRFFAVLTFSKINFFVYINFI